MGIDDESSHPRLCSEVVDGVTRIIVCLFREPDAGNLPVRFDEREQETEPRQTGLRRRRESFVSSHRETKATAPVLDSTPAQLPGRQGNQRVNEPKGEECHIAAVRKIRFDASPGEDAVAGIWALRRGAREEAGQEET